MNDLIGLAGSGVIGSLFGGLFRLAPELLKLWDRKDERRHELSMLKVQADLEKVKGDYKMEERYSKTILHKRVRDRFIYQ